MRKKLLVLGLSLPFFMILTMLFSAPPISSEPVWIEKAPTPQPGGYGQALVSVGNYIYIIRCYDVLDNVHFWRYDPFANEWTEINTSMLPQGLFRNGTALAWDNENYIYALAGARYQDSNRTIFLRYSIPSNSWEFLENTPGPQGAGDALCWCGYDGRIYAILGSSTHGTTFARYNPQTNTWQVLANPPGGTDDGCSLVWTGGAYLYALRGEYYETSPLQDFWRYNIETNSWENLSPIPDPGGVGDGGSLLWIPTKSDYIYALSGGSYLEQPGYGFYRYQISTNTWESLENLPYPVGEYNGNRLGFVNNTIFYWQGAPPDWAGGGNKFCAYPLIEIPSVLMVVPENSTIMPNCWFNVTVTVWEGEMELENIYLVAHENSLSHTASDNIRNHYTWSASKSAGAWQFSCPLGSAYIDTSGCSVLENSETKTYTAIFRVKLSKIAAPGMWNLYVRAVDNTGLDNYLENINAIMVQVYLEMSLSTYTLSFSGYKGQSVYATQSPMTVIVSSNRNFTIKVRAAGDFTSDGYTISASAAKAIGGRTVSLSTIYENVWNNIQYGENMQKQIEWRLDIPSNVAARNYTNTFYVRVETLPEPPLQLVQNPSFEQTGYWSFGTNASRSSERARTGSYSAKQVVNSSSYTAYVTSDNITSFIPGQTYYLAGYYYLVNPGGGASPSQYTLFIRVRWYPYWENDDGYVQTPSSGFASTAFDSWTLVSFQVTAPQNAVRARVFITARYTTGQTPPATSAYWDDIWLSTQPP
ncbi:MAG: hypothetical protein QW623_02290 [Candidatus Hadarchaeales archaeon]